MVSGVPKYYQIAPCFRDEDPRADRLYGDFYQLDLEMSFVDDGEVVRTEVEPLIKKLVTDFAGKKLLSREVPRLTYAEAIETYGSDKPDLRYDLKLVDLTEVLKTTEFAVFKTAECVKAICVPNGATLSRSQIDNFTNIARAEGAGGLAYLTYKDNEIQSPIAKFLSAQELTAITDLTGAKSGDTVFFAADTRPKVNKILGALRVHFADHFGLKDPNIVALAWIVDFPFYEWDEKTKRLDFGHNPFSWPKGGLDALKSADKLAILADQYDMVMNGYEICSGAVRNHQPEVMYEAFGVLGYSKPYVEAKFGGMLNAFKFGAPPHAGCAFGLDRIFMELLNLPSIRDTLAFPKNGSGLDVMMDSPSSVDPDQLKELNIKFKQQESK
jgi:aspartyl-tRNA synthetase